LKRENAWTSVPEDCDNRGSWIYQRIFTDTTSVDIAFIGTSRTINGIQDTLITRLLSDVDGKKINVANLGYCRFGTEMQFLIAKDLISKKKVRTIVLEVNEGLSGTSHPIYPYFAATEDLVHPASLMNQNTPSNYYNGFLARLTQLRATILSESQSEGTPLPNYGYRGYPGTADPATLIEPDAPHKRELNFIQRFDKIYPEAWIERTIALCRANNIEVLFVYLPSYHDQAQPQEELSFYQSHATVLIPEQKQLHRKSLWRDHDHLNDPGAQILSIWLCEQLFKHTELLKNANKNTISAQ